MSGFAVFLTPWTESLSSTVCQGSLQSAQCDAVAFLSCLHLIHLHGGLAGDDISADRIRKNPLSAEWCPLRTLKIW